MTFIPDLVLFLICLVPALASAWIGISRGRRVRTEHRPDTNHFGTVQGGLMGLLALLLGFAFSGAMGRFVDRQDSLSREANAIDTAYDRAALLPTGDRVRAALREYARLRVKLFEQTVDGTASDLGRRLQEQYDIAFAATLEGVRQAPQYTAVAISGIEGVNDQFVNRGALALRHLPLEFVIIMLASSCAALGTVGYGAGIVERRSTVSVFVLAVMVAVTLFMTFDFDRPRRGLIRLNPAPLTEVLARISNKA